MRYQLRYHPQKTSSSRSGIAWLELLLGLAVLALLLQLFPAAINIVDVRTWTRVHWFVFNAAAVVALLVARFGPGLLGDWREHRLEVKGNREKAKKKQLMAHNKTIRNNNRRTLK